MQCNITCLYFQFAFDFMCSSLLLRVLFEWDNGRGNLCVKKRCQRIFYMLKLKFKQTNMQEDGISQIYVHKNVPFCTNGVLFFVFLSLQSAIADLGACLFIWLCLSLDAWYCLTLMFALLTCFSLPILYSKCIISKL